LKPISQKHDICDFKLTKLQRFRDGRTQQNLREFIIENQNAFQYSSGELSRIINSIRLAAKGGEL
jgi:hypothetical protein